MTDIYQIKIGFRAHNSMIALNFSNFITANAAYDALTISPEPFVEIKDDCGGRIMVTPGDVMFVMFDDMTATSKMNETIQLNQARAEVHLRTAASTDPGLKAAATVANMANGARLQQ